MPSPSAFDPLLFEAIAEQLRMDVQTLERESLKTYLEYRLVSLKAEQFHIAGKYGIKTFEDMERCYREQRLSEQHSWEDFFKLDHIESEIAATEQAMEQL